MVGVGGGSVVSVLSRGEEFLRAVQYSLSISIINAYQVLRSIIYIISKAAVAACMPKVLVAACMSKVFRATLEYDKTFLHRRMTYVYVPAGGHIILSRIL